jgi:poly-gamma-glutamate capsule biosynthesis protein CapA/YwtB (metallophosphatase superfamily)
MKSDEITLLACGDVFVQRPDPGKTFRQVRDVFHQADIVFCNWESTLCSRDTPPTPFLRIIHLRSDPEMAASLVDAGIDIVSLANTHTMDYGPAGILQTMQTLDQLGIRYVGVGRNIAEAHTPVIFDIKDTRIAFLGFHTYDQYATAASEVTPGQAMVRISAYLPPPHVFREEVSLMQQDIREARKQADVVIVSWHWGQSMTRQLAVHQPYLGHLAIDAGADIVLGHHAHVLQGIELYRGKPICYSIGNFVMDGGAPMSMETLVVKCVIADKRIRRLSFLPAEGTRMGESRILPEAESETLFRDMRALCAEVRTRFTIQNNEGVFALAARAAGKRRPSSKGSGRRKA